MCGSAYKNKCGFSIATNKAHPSKCAIFPLSQCVPGDGYSSHIIKELNWVFYTQQRSLKTLINHAEIAHKIWTENQQC